MDIFITYLLHLKTKRAKLTKGSSFESPAHLQTNFPNYPFSEEFAFSEELLLLYKNRKKNALLSMKIIGCNSFVTKVLDYFKTKV